MRIFIKRISRIKCSFFSLRLEYYFSIILCFSFYATHAQKVIVNDTRALYYLVDTAKTSVGDRMWNINTGDSMFKYYTIKCPCLRNDGEPTFYYFKSKDNGTYISQKELNALKL